MSKPPGQKRVEVAGWLVGGDHVRVGYDGPGDRHPLLFQGMAGVVQPFPLPEPGQLQRQFDVLQSS